MMAVLEDGIAAFRRHMAPQAVASILAATCRWVDPATFALLPVWHPYTARKEPLYSEGWTRPMTNRDAAKFERNTAANKTLTEALGLRGKGRTNWTCCHVWGNDDALFKSCRSEVNDPRFYTCPANMVLLPTPLKAFTDAVPEVKAALRYGARVLYGFWPESRAEPDANAAGCYLPDSWRAAPGFPGVMAQSGLVDRTARLRASQLSALMSARPRYFPYAKAREAVLYWQRTCPGSLLDGILLSDEGAVP